MLLSMNWIGDFVDLSGLDRRALIRRFTLSTAEVEEVIKKGADVNGVIVAKIASVDDYGIILINRIIGSVVIIISLVVLLGTVFNLFTIQY